MEEAKEHFKLFESFEDAQKALQNNQPRLVIAGTKQLCIVRKSNNLRVFENECPHMKDGLSNGLINLRNQIVCPLHSYKFDLNTGDEDAARCPPLNFIRVLTREDGSIWLDLSQAK